MAWVYFQKTGYLLQNNLYCDKGYSGKDEDKNKPESQHLMNKGPIPRGLYTIGKPIDSATHGSFVLPLTPSSWNEMFGRNNFLIHGDSIEHPGRASEGCIILERIVREKINWSNDNQLIVV